MPNILPCAGWYAWRIIVGPSSDDWIY
jgi:hypothetical protein